MGKSFGDSARGAARDSASNGSGGWLGGKHRGKPAKGKGGVGKPEKGKRGKDVKKDWWTGKPVAEKKGGWW